MVSRVPTLLTTNRGIDLLSALNADLTRVQEQVATGRRIASPQDDPAGAARAVNLRESLARLEQYNRNADNVRPRLQFSEQTLDAVGDVVQRVRELTLQAANSTQTNESRAAIAVELRQALSGLVDLANARDGAGRYLYAGFGDRQEPFVRAGDSVSYRGDAGERQIRIAENRFVSDGNPGDRVFMNIAEANGVFTVEPTGANAGTGIVSTLSVNDASAYDGGDLTIRFLTPDNYEVVDAGGAVIAADTFVSGDAIEFNGLSVTLKGEPDAADEFSVRAAGVQSLFASVSAIASALEGGVSGAADAARLSSELNRGIENLDQALGNLTNIRTDVGARLSAVDTQIDVNEDSSLVARGILGEIEDLDYIEALSRLSQTLTAYQAAQQTFVQVQGLSLFDLLRG